MTTRRKIITMVLTVVLMFNMGVVAKASLYYNQLGSQASLGSPILDPNFSAENWNKWEMVTWGIFLSNFATPLIDDYESALNPNSTSGSKGSGYKALNFGSGSDATNQKTMQSLLNYAIQQQKSGPLKEIHVVFSPLERDGIKKVSPGGAVTGGDEGDAGDTPVEEAEEEENTASGSVRLASLRDLFILDEKDEGTSWVAMQDTTGEVVPGKAYAVERGDTESYSDSKSNYKNIAAVSEGMIPTFYISTGNGYETVLDYTNGWDAQLITAWMGRLSTSDFQDEIKKVTEGLNIHEAKLYLDVFGNIVTNVGGARRIVIPASVNQHLTQTPKINLLSSMLFNGIASSLERDTLLHTGRQSESNMFGVSAFKVSMAVGGLPAFGSHRAGIPSGMINLYYDLDTIMAQTYLKGGELSTGTKSPGGETLSTVYSVHYGKAVKALFDLDANNMSSNKYMPKIEASNMEKLDLSFFGNDDLKEAVASSVITGGQIVNLVGTTGSTQILDKLKTVTGDQKLFGEPVIVPVQMNIGVADNQVNHVGVAREYINFLHTIYKSGYSGTAGNFGADYISNLLEREEFSTSAKFGASVIGLDASIFGVDATPTTIALGGRAFNNLLAAFITSNPSRFDLKVAGSAIEGTKYKGTGTAWVYSNPFASIDNVANPLYSMKEASSNNNILNNISGRLVKVYPTSDVLKAVGNVLGIREGTEFGAYSTYIYMTYLDWYGITSGSRFGEANSELNPRIFDGAGDLLQVDITKIAPTVKSEEEKKKDILEYAYLLLHPTDGDEYKQSMQSKFLTNFIYDNYQKIVYGNASSFNEAISSRLASRNATGFLSVDSYGDNFTTAWFMDMFSKVAVWLIGISSILIMVIGLVKNRKFSWFAVSLVVVINAILIVPAVGEITPAIANRFVQSMFKDKTTYWGVSETVANANLESKALKSTNISSSFMGSLSEDERGQVVSMIKDMNTMYLDRALMVRTDISKKVTRTSYGDYGEVQKLRSARWMLPMIMRQFTNEAENKNYVYLPLGDMYDDVANIYWLYNPTDAVQSGTVVGQQSMESGYNGVVARKSTHLTMLNRGNAYGGYSTRNVAEGLVPYRSRAYDLKSTEYMTHTYFYLLKGNLRTPLWSVGFGGEYDGKASYVDYVNHALTSMTASTVKSKALELERKAGNYNRFDRSTVDPDYGYLWATETLYPYAYTMVKDSFPVDSVLGRVIGDLQGTILTDESGKEIRQSFMHAGNTGLVRDVLDIEEMFTNMIPYLYQMQLITGGTDGETGVLGNELISEYPLYKNNLRSWMFRSNWVTKIMENPDYTKEAVVRDKEGNKHTVKNPTLVGEYPETRPMVFSEAQMVSMGLSMADLSLVEMKAVQVNKDIVNEWTKLLNYVNLEGMTKEALMRQMATEAVMVFNTEFSPSGITNGRLELYPTSLDLRAISFDSVMKMLVMNSTRNTTYVYGDTMLNVVKDSDIFTGILLLLAAFISNFLIPLARNVVMGLIFYLGFFAIVRTIFGVPENKVKVSGGYILSNIVFLFMTLGYFLVFSVLMAITSTDEILTTQSVQAKPGNPVFVLIIVIVAGLMYMYGMVKMTGFCLNNYRDMGMDAYQGIASMFMERTSEAIEGVGATVSSVVSNVAGERSRYSNRGYKRVRPKRREMPRGGGDVELRRDDEEDYLEDDFESKQYRMSKNDEYEIGSTDFLNEEIEKGRGQLGK